MNYFREGRITCFMLRLLIEPPVSEAPRLELLRGGIFYYDLLHSISGLSLGLASSAVYSPSRFDCSIYFNGICGRVFSARLALISVLRA